MKLVSLAAMIRNVCSKVKRPYSMLFYVIESANWAIRWEGTYITENLNNQKLLKAGTTTTYKGIYNQIIHVGSRNLFLPNGWKRIDSSNKIVFTWFHGTEKDRNPINLAMIRALPQGSQKADIIHTSCTISKENLITWDVPEDKIVVIPSGVDLNLFKPVSLEERQGIREKLGIPKDKVAIGSFQKDGVGWDEGLEPKLIKGPDVFVKVVEQLAKKYPIYVLLVGPARGYIKNELQKRNILFKSIGYLKNFSDVAKYYHALDLYLITSRIEGGPKAILEAWASGVPVVATKVGMIPDIAKDNVNILLAETEDVKKLSENVRSITENNDLKKKIIVNAVNEVKKYNWNNIASRYYKEIYLKL